MDIIKGYEEEKMKSHLSKDELALLQLIDEFKPPEEVKTPPGFDVVKKFMPSNLSSLVGGITQSVTGQSNTAGVGNAATQGVT